MNIKSSIFAALSAALSLTACSSADTPTAHEEEVVVPFSISLPADLQTRASFGDGSQTVINQIKYSVYKVTGSGDEETTTFLYSSSVSETVTDNNNVINVSVPLPKNFSYIVTFFARNSANTFADYKNGVMTVNYSNAAPNKANADVFTGVSTKIDVTETPMTDHHAVALKRPMAQLNWGTSGIDALGDDAKTLTAAVTISSGLYTTYDVLTGVVSGEKADALSFTVNCNALPEVEFPVKVEGKDIKLVAMNYILVGKSEETETGTINTSITFSWTQGGETGEQQSRTSTASNAPCKANCRTNIYGDLILTPAIFDCTISTTFDGDDNNITPE